jgi:hypothetical protein
MQTFRPIDQAGNPARARALQSGPRNYPELQYLSRIARWFQTKNPNLGKFRRATEWKMSAYFISLRSMLLLLRKFYGDFAILLQFGIFSNVLVYCVKKNLATLFLSH